MIELPRRKLLTGILAAPIIVRTPGLLMPVKAAPSPIGFYDADFFGLTTIGDAYRLGCWHLRASQFPKELFA